ncbi:hypothetical protein KEM55_006741 [Ascosphaera atra]|nr:hypothetical protein KEM55_008854 [Ascosphaera atra]KAI5294172.1 hypothetical protein KEM55_006741 [Ascosphaera atra]
MSAPQKIAGDAQSIGKFLDNYDTFLFDCDGVLWSGNKLFDRTVETLEMLRSKGKKLVFVTNNSSKCRSDYKKKLDSLGIPATVEDIFPSSYSSAIYISRILNLPPKKNKVFVIGKSGIEQELEAEGVRYIGGTDPAYNREITAEDYDKIATGDPSILDPEVGVVLVGLDWNANYLKHSLAYHYILRGAHFLATNLDPTFPSHGTFFPGAGTCSAPLVTMLKGQQPISLGKPSQAMMDAIEGKFKLDRARTVMVGDRMDTDIKFGIEGGLGGTLAVLTGVSSEEEVLSSASKPKYYVNTLSDLLCGQE